MHSETKDFYFDNNLFYEIDRFCRRIIANFNVEFKEYGVTYATWRILVLLWQHDGLTQAAISTHCTIQPATIVRTLDRMEQNKFIFRSRSKKDRRIYHIYLTEKGIKAKSLKEKFNRFENETFSALSADKLKNFKANLRHCFENIKK